MAWIRKKFLLLLILFFVYGAFSVSHLHTSSPQVLGAQQNLTLFEEPIVGKDPLLSAINASQKEVDVEVYLLSDKDIITSLMHACQRGILVQILLEQHPFGGGTVNQQTYQTLSNSCVKVAWTNPSYALTHEKTVVIDSKEAFILTQNLTTAAFVKNREYDVTDVNPQDVLEIVNIFHADWNRTNFIPSTTNLLISPITSRDNLMQLITNAQQSLSIEMEAIDDPQIIALLIQKAPSVKISLILPSFSQMAANKKVAQKLSNAGVVIKTMSSPYIHAKLIIADVRKAYVGSINLTTQSMDNNREVGVLITEQDIVQNLSSDFAADWESAIPMSL